MTGCYRRPRVPPDARKKIVDPSAAARSLEAMLKRPAERLIIGHGESLTNGWGEQLVGAWRMEGVQI